MIRVNNKNLEVGLEKAAFVIYLIVLILSPLLFGAVHAYAYTIMTLGVLFASLLLIKNNIKKDLKTGIYRFNLPSTSLNFCFILLLFFMIFQIVPLPGFLLELLSPESLIAGKKSLPASDLAGMDSRISEWFSIASYNYPIRMSIIRWTVYGLFFIGFSQTLNSRKRIELAVVLILITGCFEALYGLIETFSGSGHIWWYKKERYLGDVSGTFLNRNHFAGLMEIIILLATAYAASISARKKRNESIPGNKKNRLRAGLGRFLSGERRFNKRILILFAGSIMGIGLVFSASRGGIIATGGGLLCLSLLFIFRKRHRRKGLIVLFMFLIIAIYSINIGIEYPASRFEYFGESYKVRARWAQKALDLFKDYWITGVGVGDFQYAYPKYQAVEKEGWFIRHVHNDWVQFLAEAGIVGFCLMLIGVSYHIFKTMKLWKKRRDPFAVSLGAVPLAAMAAIALHSYSDFNLHLPSIFLMLTAVMAVGYSALHTEKHHGMEKSFYPYVSIPLKYKGILILIPLLTLIVWSGYWITRHFIAECYCNTVTQYMTLNRDQHPPRHEIEKAIKWDSKNADYWFKLGWKLKKVMQATLPGNEWDSKNGQKEKMDVIRAFEKFVSLNPLMPEPHLYLGWEYAGLWQRRDYQQKWLPAADRSMERASYLTGDYHLYVHENLGNYWIMRSKTISPVDPEWHTAWANARWHYKKVLSLKRGKDLKKTIEKIKKYVWTHYPDERFIRDALNQK